jgi:hypothetical protein
MHRGRKHPSLADGSNVSLHAVGRRDYGRFAGRRSVLVAVDRRCPSRNVKTAHRVCQFGIGGLAGFNLTFHKGEKGSRQ